MIQQPEDPKIMLSFDRVYEKYHKRIYYYALGYLKSREDAEEVVQEVFLNLWKSRDQISEYYVFSHYLFKITFNAIFRVFRKQSSERKHLKQAIKGIYLEDDSTSNDIEYENLLEVASIYFEKLPERQKSIFCLSVNENFSNEEIARKLNISKKTVDNYLSDARTFLKRSFIEGGLISPLFFHLFLRFFC